MLPKVQIFSDGACSPNPGSGGWGAVLLFGEDRDPVELAGAEEPTTNNRMELMAAIGALEYLDRPHQIDIYTDSKYVKRGITQWLVAWQKRGWQTKENTAVKNQDLWKTLSARIEDHRVTWHWLKGHANHQWNERADQLARQAVNRAPLPLDDEAAIHIFCAISYRQKTRTGGWCVVLRFGRHLKVLSGSESTTTGNRMHILSAIEGLAAIKRPLPVHLYTYSGYLKDGATTWIRQWSARNWRTQEDRPVRHRDLWVRLARLMRSNRATWHIADKACPPCHMQAAKLIAHDILD